MTTDLAPKEFAARITSRARGLDRRHGEGRRHDRADDGDDARFVTTDAVVPPALLDRALARGGRSDVQKRESPWTAIRRPRLCPAARQRRERRRGRRSSYGTFSRADGGLPGAGARHRPAGVKAQPTGDGECDRRRVKRRGAKAAKVIANIRCSSRRPSTAAIQTGTPHLCGGPGGVAFDASRAACRWDRSCCSRMASLTTSWRRQAAEYLRARLTIGVDLGCVRFVDGVDLRSERRILADQCRLQNLTTSRGHGGGVLCSGAL